MGDAVFAGIAAANRDPEEFAHPDGLDFERKGGRNLSFGAGAFYCMGAAHARVQSEEAIAALLRTFDVPTVAKVEWKSFPLVLRGPRSARISVQQIPINEKARR
jgi:cytochrome P450